MPIYVYRCPECGEQFDKMQPFSAENVYPCPTCHAQAKRQLQPAGIIFKGSGWYITDSRKQDAEQAKRAAGPDKPATEGSDAPKSETPSSEPTPAPSPASSSTIEPSSTPV